MVVHSGEERMSTLDETSRHREILDGSGISPRGLVAQQRDATARHSTIDALREDDRRKDEFLATLGHELRNPLSPIKVAVQLLRRFNSSAPQRKALDIIDRQVASLSDLAEDLMDVAS